MPYRALIFCLHSSVRGCRDAAASFAPLTLSLPSRRSCCSSSILKKKIKSLALFFLLFLSLFVPFSGSLWNILRVSGTRAATAAANNCEITSKETKEERSAFLSYSTCRGGGARWRQQHQGPHSESSACYLEGITKSATESSSKDEPTTAALVPVPLLAYSESMRNRLRAIPASRKTGSIAVAPNATAIGSTCGAVEIFHTGSFQTREMRK